MERNVQRPEGMTAWLSVLRRIVPPKGVLVVGAGNGAGQWVQWLVREEMSSVCLVEGDWDQYQHLKHAIPQHLNWELRRDVVAAEGGAAIFYQASNHAESSLLQPEQLATLWPHLSTARTDRVEAALTLDSLSAEHKERFSWLVVDCLPAVTLLRGATNTLRTADVVVVRAALDEGLSHLSDVHASEVSAVLGGVGLVPRFVQAQRHPLLVHILFTRDFGSQTEQLQAARKEVAQARELQEAHAQRIAQLERANEASIGQPEIASLTKPLAQQLVPEQTVKPKPKVPLDKSVAFNWGYRQQWIDYLAEHGKDEIAKRRGRLLSGLDKQSREIVDIQLEIIGNVAPSRLLKYLSIDDSCKLDLLPEKSKEIFDSVGYFDRQQELLTQLQTKLRLPEMPLKELLTHSGLLYLGKIAKQRIKNGVVIDAGAYIGDTAHFLYKMYEAKKVIALEAHPKTFSHLKSLVELWGLQEVIEPIQCAVGMDGREMTLWGEGLGASQIKKVSGQGTAGPEKHVVAERSIDGLVAERELQDLALIKLDVEGAEMAAVHGAMETIKRFRPILLVSIYHTARDFFEIKPLLESLDLGYKFMIRKTTDDLIKEFVLIAYTEE